MKHGWMIYFPCSDSLPHDFVVGVPPRGSLVKVQVKHTSVLHKSDVYKINCRKNAGSGTKQAYADEDFDFLAAFIDPLKLWYIIPNKNLPAAITLYPHRATKKGAKYEQYLEAWNLIDEYTAEKP